MNTNILAFTTISQGDPNNPIESTRAAVVLDTMKQLQIHNITCIVVFRDCEAIYLKQLQAHGAVLVQETMHGMGNSRREALQEAVLRASSNTHLFWLEPEKPDIPRYVSRMHQHMIEADVKLGLFNRTAHSMSSYPIEQSHYYQFCRAAASALAEFDIDYAFGPMMIHIDATTGFTTYNSKYDDLWDSILVPRIPFLKHGKIVTLDVDFHNDRRMTQIESGDTKIILKRLRQFNNVIPSLINEW